MSALPSFAPAWRSRSAWRLSSSLPRVVLPGSSSSALSSDCCRLTPDVPPSHHQVSSPLSQVYHSGRRQGQDCRVQSGSLPTSLIRREKITDSLVSFKGWGACLHTLEYTHTTLGGLGLRRKGRRGRGRRGRSRRLRHAVGFSSHGGKDPSAVQVRDPCRRQSQQ